MELKNKNLSLYSRTLLLRNKNLSPRSRTLLLRNKKVAILGLRVENLPLAHFLIGRKANVAVCDKDEQLRNKKEVKRLNGVKEWRLGPNYLKDLSDFEIVFRTPGLSLLTPEIIQAKKQGVIISSATKLFFDLSPAKIIGVTGTKGKGTCASLIKAMLKLKIKNEKLKNRIWFGGNIGNSAISLLEKIKQDDWVVLELSSFQLQDLEKSPHIAVVLNIFPDHLDYHKSKREYVQSKEHIVFYQKKSDYSVINADYFTSYRFAALTKGKVLWFSSRKSVDEGCFMKWKTDKGKGQKIREIILRTKEKDYFICKNTQIKLIGEHNLENICAAIVVANLVGIDINDIKKIVTNFTGLEHRIEFIKRINQVNYYNDSYATTPESTIAAIKSFSAPVVLICGGLSKNGDYQKLINTVSQSTVKSIILIGQEANIIFKKLFKAKNLNVINLGFSKMINIVKTAQKEAEGGNIVLFSPGCASFDMFKNASDRGKQFKKAVLSL